MLRFVATHFHLYRVEYPRSLLVSWAHVLFHGLLATKAVAVRMGAWAPEDVQKHTTVLHGKGERGVRPTRRLLTSNCHVL